MSGSVAGAVGLRRGRGAPEFRLRRPRAPVGVALAVALVLHVVGLLLLDRFVWQDQAVVVPGALEVVLVRRSPQVVLPAPARLRLPPAVPQVAAPALPRVVPDAAPAAPRVQVPAVPVDAVAPEQPRERVPGPAVAEEPRRMVLFAPDGRLRVPASVLEGEPEPVPSWIEAPRAVMPWEQRADPLVYEPTLFEPMWKPDQETLLGEFFRRNTQTRTFKTPWGTKVKCVWVLIVGGCGW